MSNYQLYRCQTDGKLVFPNEFEAHNGHRLGLAREGTVLEFLRIKWKDYKGLLKKRESYQ